MPFKHSRATLLTGACAAALCAGALINLEAQQPAPGGRGGRGAGAAAGVFTAADQNNDGFVTRDELKAAFAKWLSGDSAMTQDQLAAAVSAALPQPAPPPAGRGAAPQNQTPKPEDVEKMMAALPDKAPGQTQAAPQGPRPRQGRRLRALLYSARRQDRRRPGPKTGAWSTTVTYDPAAITAQNLKQYDLLFLDNTTGAFLDDPNDASATDARKKRAARVRRGPEKAWPEFTPPAIPTTKPAQAAPPRRPAGAAAPARPSPPK